MLTSSLLKGSQRSVARLAEVGNDQAWLPSSGKGQIHPVARLCCGGVLPVVAIGVAPKTESYKYCNYERF